MKYKKIYELLVNNSNYYESIKMKKYMRNQFDYLGIKKPERVNLTRNLLLEYKKESEIDWEFVFKCFNSEYRELIYIAIDYLRDMNKHLTYSDLDNIKKLIEIKTWWDTTDTLNRLIAKIALKDEKVHELMLKWSTDNNFWIRRVAIIYQLGLKNNVNLYYFNKILINNLNQKEFFINKAIGWSLRDYAKFNENWTVEFIKNNKDSMSKLSIREATKYINKKL